MSEPAPLLGNGGLRGQLAGRRDSSEAGGTIVRTFPKQRPTIGTLSLIVRIYDVIATDSYPGEWRPR